MADLHFPAELPVAEIGRLVAAVRAGDFVATETVDSALYVGGCLNALRGPTPFGADGSDLPSEAKIVGEMDDETLCKSVEHHVGAVPVGAAAGDDAEAIPPVVTVFLFELLSRVLSRFLNR